MRLVEEGIISENDYKDAAERLLAGISLDVSGFLREIEEESEISDKKEVSDVSFLIDVEQSVTDMKNEPTNLIIRPDEEFEDLSDTFNQFLSGSNRNSRMLVDTQENTGIFLKANEVLKKQISNTNLSVLPPTIVENIQKEEQNHASKNTEKAKTVAIKRFNVETKRKDSGEFKGSFEQTVPNFKQPLTARLRVFSAAKEAEAEVSEYEPLPMTAKTGSLAIKGVSEIHLSDKPIEQDHARSISQILSQPLVGNSAQNKLSVATPMLRDVDSNFDEKPTKIYSRNASNQNEILEEGDFEAQDTTDADFEAQDTIKTDTDFEAQDTVKTGVELEKQNLEKQDNEPDAQDTIKIKKIKYNKKSPRRLMPTNHDSEVTPPRGFSVSQGPPKSVISAEIAKVKPAQQRLKASKKSSFVSTTQKESQQTIMVIIAIILLSFLVYLLLS